MRESFSHGGKNRTIGSKNEGDGNEVRSVDMCRPGMGSYLEHALYERIGRIKNHSNAAGSDASFSFDSTCGYNRLKRCSFCRRPWPAATLCTRNEMGEG